ncbi:MAG: ornithine cyclodeaminase family protein [Ignavibacteria bacterium]|nr:ornithine cyclodeaminase family protein [Ignavibacteria bacterium]
MRYIGRKEIAQLISMREVMELMREVFCEVSKGTVVMPPRAVVELNNRSDTVLFMPGYVPHSRGIGVKIVSVFSHNAASGMPTISALIVLMNPETGGVLSVMEGGYITALRTGATSGVATDLLARSDDVRRLGIFGSGAQAWTQIAAILEVRPIREVSVYSRDKDRSRDFVMALRKQYGPRAQFEVADSPEKAVSQADIVVTATTSETPVFDGTLLREGTHINSIGSFKPQVREVDDHTVRRSRIFVDSRDACLHEAGDLLIPIEKGVISRSDIRAELGELLLARKPGRESDRDITYFKSVGMSVQDIVVAERIHAKAVEQNVGQMVGD